MVGRDLLLLGSLGAAEAAAAGSVARAVCDGGGCLGIAPVCRKPALPEPSLTELIIDGLYDSLKAFESLKLWSFNLNISHDGKSSTLLIIVQKVSKRLGSPFSTQVIIKSSSLRLYWASQG